MSSPFNSHGYDDLRDYAYNTYTVVALIDDTGSEITRIDITSDSRLVNAPDDTTNPLTYQLEITGSDSDIPNPVTIASTKLYESMSDSTPVGSDSMKNATVEANNDVVTVSHDVELPPI